jgi:hypothetical protein
MVRSHVLPDRVFVVGKKQLGASRVEGPTERGEGRSKHPLSFATEIK